MLLRPLGRPTPDPIWQIYPGWCENRQYYDGMVPSRPQVYLLISSKERYCQPMETISQQSSLIVLEPSDKLKEPIANLAVLAVSPKVRRSLSSGVRFSESVLTISRRKRPDERRTSRRGRGTEFSNPASHTPHLSSSNPQRSFIAIRRILGMR